MGKTMKKIFILILVGLLFLSCAHQDNLTEEESFIASFYPDSISSPNLVSPKDNLTDANVSQSFEWSSVNYADNYRFELSTVEDFSSLVKDEKTIENKISISNLDPKQT